MQGPHSILSFLKQTHYLTKLDKVGTWHLVAAAKRWQYFCSAFSRPLFQFLLSGLEAEKTSGLTILHQHMQHKLKLPGTFTHGQRKTSLWSFQLERRSIWSISWQDLEFGPKICLFEFGKEGGFHIYDATRAGKSKSLIRWKRLKGGKRRKKAEKANLIYN